MPFYNWSTTPTSNAASDSTCPFPEGMSPSAVNDGVRALMARLREYANDIAGAIVTTGTSTAYAVVSNEAFTALSQLANQAIGFVPHMTCGATVTLNVDLLGAIPLRVSPGAELQAGQLLQGVPCVAVYNATDGAFYLRGYMPVILAANQVATSNIADKAVTLRKLYHPNGPSLLLGTSPAAAQTISNAANNGAGAIRLTVGSATSFSTGQKKTVSDVVGTTEANGTWTITVVDANHIDLQGSTFANAYASGGTIGGGAGEIAVGQGLVYSGDTLTAPAAPVPGSFRNLVIKVTGNTTVAVTADYVALTDGTNYLTLPVSGSINFSTTGANALDTGSIASATWYNLFQIATPAGSVALLASTSATAPVMPSGYTFKARIGAVRTAAAVAQLMGTWQFGRHVEYILGLAQTSIIPLIHVGALAGWSTSTPTWNALSISSYVPPTASVGYFTCFSGYNSNTGNVALAPNSSYGGVRSTSPPPLSADMSANNVCSSGAILLQSMNIYYIGDNNGSAASCYGWDDNL